MTRVLPPQPNLDRLRNEAKSLLKACRAGDASVCKTFALRKRFHKVSDEKILTAKISLHEAQFALSMDYGFRSWDDLRHHVINMTTPPESETEARPGALLLENPPAGAGNSNRVVRGIGMMLSHADLPNDYHTLMGDSGAAFILQADSKATPFGKPVKQIDIGWWPLASWGALMRSDFFGRTVGRSLVLKHIHKGNPTADQKVRVRQEVTEILGAGQTCLAMADHWYAITGLDNGEPPLLGVRTVFDGHELRRLPEWPCTLLMLGKPVPVLDRAEADRRALAHAIALARDDIEELVKSAVDCPLQGGRDANGKTTGQASFALWARLLRDPDGWGAHFYHANVVFHLAINRRSAPIYLRAIADRRPEAAKPLQAAAGVYERILTTLSSADTSKEIMLKPDGREALAMLVEEIAELEAKAIDDVENAFKVMK